MNFPLTPQKWKSSPLDRGVTDCGEGRGVRSRLGAQVRRLPRIVRRVVEVLVETRADVGAPWAERPAGVRPRSVVAVDAQSLVVVVRQVGSMDETETLGPPGPGRRFWELCTCNLYTRAPSTGGRPTTSPPRALSPDRRRRLSKASLPAVTHVLVEEDRGSKRSPTPQRVPQSPLRGPSPPVTGTQTCLS